MSSTAIIPFSTCLPYEAEVYVALPLGWSLDQRNARCYEIYKWLNEHIPRESWRHNRVDNQGQSYFLPRDNRNLVLLFKLTWGGS